MTANQAKHTQPATPLPIRSVGEQLLSDYLAAGYAGNAKESAVLAKKIMHRINCYDQLLEACSTAAASFKESSEWGGDSDAWKAADVCEAALAAAGGEQ